MDKAQERYLEHQRRKKESILQPSGNDPSEYNRDEVVACSKMLNHRRSQRTFNDMRLPLDALNIVCEAVRIAPSSCNRQAIYVKPVSSTYVANTLVGGRGWAHNAPAAVLLFASKQAYKSPNEKEFMPYLDAGCSIQNIYLMLEIYGLGCCFINPNIIKEKKSGFLLEHGDNYFCGAIVLGHYDFKSKKPPIRSREEVLVK